MKALVKILAWIIGLIIIVLLAMPFVIGQFATKKLVRELRGYTDTALNMEMKNIAIDRGWFHSTINFNLVPKNALQQKTPFTLHAELNLSQGPFVRYNYRGHNDSHLALLGVLAKVTVATEYPHIQHMPTLTLAACRPFHGSTQVAFSLPIDMHMSGFKSKDQYHFRLNEYGDMVIDDGDIYGNMTAKNFTIEANLPPNDDFVVQSHHTWHGRFRIENRAGDWLVYKNLQIPGVTITNHGKLVTQVEGIRTHSINSYAAKTLSINSLLSIQKQTGPNGVSVHNLVFGFKIDHLHRDLGKVISSILASKDKMANAKHLVSALTGTSLSIDPLHFQVAQQTPISMQLHLRMANKPQSFHAKAFAQLTGVDKPTIAKFNPGQRYVLGFLQAGNARLKAAFPIAYARMLAVSAITMPGIIQAAAKAGHANKDMQQMMAWVSMGGAALSFMQPQGAHAVTDIQYTDHVFTVNGKPFSFTPEDITKGLQRFLPAPMQVKPGHHHAVK